MKESNRESKRRRRKLHHATFATGDLYLFHPSKKYCPSRGSLWGIYDKIEDGIIYLESSTFDLQHFSIRHRLPAKYRYRRRATRHKITPPSECSRRRDLPNMPQCGGQFADVRADVIKVNPFTKIGNSDKIRRPESKREYMTIEEPGIDCHSDEERSGKTGLSVLLLLRTED